MSLQSFQNRFQRWYFRNAPALILVTYVGSKCLSMFAWVGRLWRYANGTPNLGFRDLPGLLEEKAEFKVQNYLYKLGPWTRASASASYAGVSIQYTLNQKPGCAQVEIIRVYCPGKNGLLLTLEGGGLLEFQRLDSSSIFRHPLWEHDASALEEFVREVRVLFKVSMS